MITEFTMTLMMEIWNLSCKFVYFDDRATEAQAAVDSSVPALKTPAMWLRQAMRAPSRDPRGPNNAGVAYLGTARY
jgi:hypothetical protein